MSTLILLLATAFAAGPFGPPDTDHDAVSDADDKCMGLEETANNYHDDNGCPDVMPAIRLRTTFRDEPITADVYRVQTPAGLFTSNVEPLIPFVRTTTATVAAARECLEGEAQLAIDESATALLDLHPLWDIPLQIDVHGPDGQPVREATITFLASSTPGCAPAAAALPGGIGTILVGRSEHLVRIEAPGMAPTQRLLRLTEGSTLTILPVRMHPVGGAPPDRLARITFETDSATLSPEAMGVLDEVAEHLNAQAVPSEVVLGGHADPRGADAYNAELSFERAQAVRDYLADQGVDTDQLILVPRGERDAVHPESDPEAWPYERRVDVLE